MRLRMGDRTMTPPKLPPRSCASLRLTEAYLGERHPASSQFPPTSTTPSASHEGRRPHRRTRSPAPVNEPTAASLAYGIDKRNDGMSRVRLRRRTSTSRSSRLHEGIFEVLATNGDTLSRRRHRQPSAHIALEDAATEWGRDVDHRQRSNVSPGRHPRQGSFRSRPRLSSTLFTAGRATAHAARAHFESLIKDIVDRTLAPSARTARRRLGPDQIDEVVMVRSTRIPLVRNAVRKLSSRAAYGSESR